MAAQEQLTDGLNYTWIEGQAPLNCRFICLIVLQLNNKSRRNGTHNQTKWPRQSFNGFRRRVFSTYSAVLSYELRTAVILK